MVVSATRLSAETSLAIESNPALLTGDAHRAPLRVIPRFVEHLHVARHGDGTGLSWV